MTRVTAIIRRRRAQRAQRMAQAKRQRTLLLTLILLLLVLVVLPVGAGAALGLAYYADVVQALPAPQQNARLEATQGPSQMFDRTGQVLLWSIEDPLGDDREWIALDDLPDHVIQATLLSEDPDFLQAAAPSLVVNAQRLLQNYFYGPLGPDASLTGRLVRNRLASPPEQATAATRAREYVLVAELNRLYSAQELLEWHLNTNYYGNDAYGIDAAARIYFDQPAAALTVNQVAMLAAIPTAPQYNPVDDPIAAQGRQAALLREMLINNVISQDVYNTAEETPTLVRTDPAQAPAFAPAYAIYARQQAENILTTLGYDGVRLVSRGGLRIVTALDMTIYEQATCTLENHLSQLAGAGLQSPEACVGVGYLPVTEATSAPPDSGAVAVVDVRTGELVAATGDVVSPTRQPGVVLHPFVYMGGFSRAFYTPATMVLDTPQRFPGAADGLIYTPQNPDGSFTGPVNLRDAMALGLLPPVVQVANTQGLDNILSSARLIGLENLDTTTYDLSLLERGGGVSVLNTTYAYSVFATLGEMRGVQAATPQRGFPPRDPVAVLRIEDADGTLLWSYDSETDVHITPILDDGLAYLINDILADQQTRASRLGAGNLLETPRPAAVVNGYVGNRSAAWTVGYSPDLAVGVWVGRADEAEIGLDAQALGVAAPVWRALMDYSHDRYGLGAAAWPRPDNIVEARVCERSGYRPNGACPERTEIFLENTQPPDVDTYWQLVDVNTQTNQLATANTPTNYREERRYFVPPSEAADWWQASQPLSAQLPTEYDTITRPQAVSSTVILRPEVFDYVSGEVDIRGSTDGENLQYYQLAYGQGLNPSEWVDITGQRTDYTPGQSLATWDTTNLNGLYNLRFTAVMRDNSIDPYIVQVTVDNTPPSIELSSGGVPGEPFSFLGNRVIPLQANVEDNIAIDRVEFYYAGEFVGTDDQFPFGYEHEILSEGDKTFRAVAFDAAGNQASTELTVSVVRGGG